MKIIHPLDFIFTLLIIAIGSANLIVFDMSRLFIAVQLIFMLVGAARLGYTLAKDGDYNQ